jgi:hypothetical protein
MVALLCFSLVVLASPAENAALRHQLMVLQRKVRGRVHFTNSDRLFFIHLYRWFPSVLKAMMIIRPETLVRWHHAGLVATGAGNPAPREADRKSKRNCGR